MMTEREIDFRNHRGQRLRGTLHLPEAERSVGVGVVVCHGMLSSRRSVKHRGVCEALAASGFHAFRFDFAGRGESEGRLEELCFENQVEDLEAAVEVIVGEVDRLGLVGSSMGAGVMFLAARSLPKVGAVAGISALGRPVEVMTVLAGGPDGVAAWERRGWLELRGGGREGGSTGADRSGAGPRLGIDLLRSARRADIRRAAASLERPVLLIHGELDEVVPLEQARELASLSGARLVVIEGGDHMLHRDEDLHLIQREVLDFFSRHLSRAREGDRPSR